MVVPAFMPFAKDKGIVTGGLSLYLSTEQAEHLRGGFMTANCKPPSLSLSPSIHPTTNTP